LRVAPCPSVRLSRASSLLEMGSLLTSNLVETQRWTGVTGEHI